MCHNAIKYSISDKMTSVRFNSVLHVLCSTWVWLYVQFKRVSNVQFAQELGRYACEVVQLLPAAPLPPAPALWRGQPTCAVPQCPAGAARLQCHSDQQLVRKQNKLKKVFHLFDTSSFVRDLNEQIK